MTTFETLTRDRRRKIMELNVPVIMAIENDFAGRRHVTRNTSLIRQFTGTSALSTSEMLSGVPLFYYRNVPVHLNGKWSSLTDLELVFPLVTWSAWEIAHTWSCSSTGYEKIFSAGEKSQQVKVTACRDTDELYEKLEPAFLNYSRKLSKSKKVITKEMVDAKNAESYKKAVLKSQKIT
jgi:hypothetical protein